MEHQFPNLRHLRACLKVAETNSVSVASAHVHLSQPAVSQIVSKLERTLAVALFDRGAGGLFPTAQGQRYFDRIQRALELIEQGSRAASRNSGGDGSGGRQNFYRFVTAGQIRALIALSQTGNFTIAAHSVGITQPSLHRAARELEKLAQIPLFQAHARGVRLTAAAQELARYSMLANAELRHANDELRQGSHGEIIPIRVGSLALARSEILPRAIGKMQQKNVQILVSGGSYDEQINRLRHGEIDLVIGALRATSPATDVVQETLFEDRLAIVTVPEHPLANVAAVSVEDLRQHDWIAPPKNTPTGQYLFRKLGIQEMDITPVKVVASSQRLVRGLLNEGQYLTVISSHQVAREIKQSVLVQLPIDMADSAREIGLTYRQDWHPIPLQEEFIKTLRAVCLEM